MAKDRLRSAPAEHVLGALLAHPDRELFGLELGELAGLGLGRVHPVLARFEGVGWVTSRWEDVPATDDAADGDRPARRCYRLTADGAQAARAVLAAASRRSVMPRLRPAAGAA